MIAHGCLMRRHNVPTRLTAQRAPPTTPHQSLFNRCAPLCFALLLRDYRFKHAVKVLANFFLLFGQWNSTLLQLFDHECLRLQVFFESGLGVTLITEVVNKLYEHLLVLSDARIVMFPAL